LLQKLFHEGRCQHIDLFRPVRQFDGEFFRDYIGVFPGFKEGSVSGCEIRKELELFPGYQGDVFITVDYSFSGIAVCGNCDNSNLAA
jgi:hypothetical protein